VKHPIPAVPNFGVIATVAPPYNDSAA
jgi:hypothetical protein